VNSAATCEPLVNERDFRKRRSLPAWASPGPQLLILNAGASTSHFTRRIALRGKLAFLCKISFPERLSSLGRPL
jgi:hypothetical protein